MKLHRIPNQIFIFAVLLFFAANCDSRTSDPLQTHFEYRNLTPNEVEMKLYKNDGVTVESDMIQPNEIMKKTYFADDVHAGDPGFAAPFQDVDKILIRFVNSNLCVVNFPKLKNVKQYDNFSESMYHNRTNTLIYNIDAEEMNAAGICP